MKLSDALVIVELALNVYCNVRNDEESAGSILIGQAWEVVKNSTEGVE